MIQKPLGVLCYIVLVLIVSLLIACSKKNSPSAPNPNKTGSLQITIVGLSSYHQANISITGPSNYNKTVISDILLSNLETGMYVINASIVIDTTGDTIQTTTPTQQVLVEDNKTSSVTVQYNQTSQNGSLSITINGLPNGVNGLVKLFDSNNAFLQDITGSTQINSLLPGSYKIIANPVLSGIDSLFADPDSSLVTILSGQLSNITINYQLKFVMKVFAQLNNGSITASIGAILDNSNFSDAASDLDPAMAQRYSNDVCKLVVADVTKTGFSKSISGSAGGGSTSITQTLNVIPGSQVTLNSTTDVSASTPGAQSFGQISVISETRAFPYILQFENPNRDSVEVRFTWSASGSASGGGTDPSRAGASVQSWLHLPTTTCYTNLWQTNSVLSFSAFYSHTGNDSPPSTTDTTIVFKSSFFMIGVDFQSKCLANGFLQQGAGSGDGSGSGTGTITTNITATITRY